MARVERFTSEEQIPVQQAQLVDPRSFPADISSAEALRVAGETAKDIGLKLEQERKVKQELAKRKRDAQDRIGITDANAIMDNAEREYAKRIIGKPLTEHESIRLDELNKARAKVSQLDLSPDAREIVDSNADIKADRFNDIAELANIQATNRDALIKTSEAYETALIEGDVSSIDDAEVLLDEQLKNMPSAEAAKFKEELEERAVKEMEANALAEQMNKAAINPKQATNPEGTGSIDKELKARAKGKKPSSEFAFLSNTDLEAIRDYANSIEDKAKSDSKIAANAAIKDSYQKIIGGDVDIVSMANEILANLVMADDDKNTAVERVKRLFNTWNSDTDKKIITSDSTRIKALKIISDVRTADITEDEGLDKYIKLSKAEQINGIDGKNFINDIFTASKSAEVRPLSTNRAKIYFGSLQKLYEDGDVEALEFDKMHTALREFFDQEPPPTPEQANKFYGELTHSITESWLTEMWDKWIQSPFGVVGRKALGIKKETEKKSPFPEYPDAFLEDGVWKVIKDGKKYRIE